MASLIGEQHEVESKRRAWETERQQPTLPERSGISSDSNDGKDNGGCRKEKREQRKNNHVNIKMTVSSQWLSGEKRIIYSPPRERPHNTRCGKQTNKATWCGSLATRSPVRVSTQRACSQRVSNAPNSTRRGVVIRNISPGLDAQRPLLPPLPLCRRSRPGW